MSSPNDLPDGGLHEDVRAEVGAGTGGEPVIRCSGLSRTFPGPPPVHALVSAEVVVHPGEMLAIRGRSGSGKTTLLSILGMLDTPTSGSYYLNGIDVRSLSGAQLDRLRGRSLGFVFQGFHLLGEFSAFDNVSLALDYSSLTRADKATRCREALDEVGLSHRTQALVRNLSGGEKQRVAIARALVHRPAVILADEPTGNLDSENERVVLELLRRTSQAGTGVVIVTHSHEVAQFCDRVAHMNDGVLS